MKANFARFLLGLWLTGPTLTASAAVFNNWTGTQTIPDNDASGLAFSFSLDTPATAVAEIAVALDISGGFNGDLYAYLSHEDGFAVLLNRVGRTTSSEYGYANAGFAVSLTGSATSDIHNYQTLGPSYNGNGQLLGTWAADGRDVDPTLALETTVSTATLASFNGCNPNGIWTIYFRDVSPGGVSTLNGWSVEVTAVPEPAHSVLTMAAVLGIFVLFQHRR